MLVVGGHDVVDEVASGRLAINLGYQSNHALTAGAAARRDYTRCRAAAVRCFKMLVDEQRMVPARVDRKAYMKMKSSSCCCWTRKTLLKFSYGLMINSLESKCKQARKVSKYGDLQVELTEELVNEVLLTELLLLLVEVAYYC